MAVMLAELLRFPSIPTISHALDLPLCHRILVWAWLFLGALRGY
jgi:hypothetical protein